MLIHIQYNNFFINFGRGKAIKIKYKLLKM